MSGFCDACGRCRSKQKGHAEFFSTFTGKLRCVKVLLVHEMTHTAQSLVFIYGHTPAKERARMTQTRTMFSDSDDASSLGFIPEVAARLLPCCAAPRHLQMRASEIRGLKAGSSSKNYELLFGWTEGWKDGQKDR